MTLLLTLNVFTPCSSASIVNFEQLSMPGEIVLQEKYTGCIDLIFVIELLIFEEKQRKIAKLK